jgi:S-adenosylmethionine synthetase
MRSSYVFISESVTEGHPDKLCDQISDAIVGRLLRRDPHARVVAECAVSTAIVFLSVKTRSLASIDFAEAARDVLRRVGYEHETFDARSCTVMTSLDELGPEQPAAGSALEPEADDSALSGAAQDQATVFGFACDHTEAYVPLPIWLAHRLARRLSEARRTRALAYLAPDGKTQVGVEFSDGRPKRIQSVSVVAAQRDRESPTLERLREEVLREIVREVFATESIGPDEDTRIAVNPDGVFAKSGPAHHAGLTGRKNAVDTYGGFARHSGAALSGKDPGRIDRVGAYAARYAAKNVVAAGLASQCEVALSYSIGLASPASIQVETFGTSLVPEEEIVRRIERAFDFRLAAIARHFGLRELAQRDDDGFYTKLASYGHVGRPELDLPWERLDRLQPLREA